MSSRHVLKLELVDDDFFWSQRQKKSPQHSRRRNFEKWKRRHNRLGRDKRPSSVYRHLDNGDKQRVQGVRDYSQANRTGSRGIYEYFHLEDGEYTVVDRHRIGSVNEYTIKIQDGKEA